SGHPDKPLVSYQTNRQLSGWNPPPLVIRAFGAHCQKRKSVTVVAAVKLFTRSKQETAAAGAAPRGRGSDCACLSPTHPSRRGASCMGKAWGRGACSARRGRLP